MRRCNHDVRRRPSLRTRIRSTDDDEILGSAATYHDIRVARMTVAQGYNADGTGNPTSMMSDDAPADLNVGVSYFHVEVEHRGSDPTPLTTHWNVTLTITVTHEGWCKPNQCPPTPARPGLEPAYTLQATRNRTCTTPTGDGNPDLNLVNSPDTLA